MACAQTPKFRCACVNKKLPTTDLYKVVNDIWEHVPTLRQRMKMMRVVAS